MKYKKTNSKISLFHHFAYICKQKPTLSDFKNRILIHFQMNTFAVLPTQLGHENKDGFLLLRTKWFLV